MPFYGDRLDELLKQLADTPPGEFLARGVADHDQEFLQFEADTLEEIRSREHIRDDRISLEMNDPEVGERGALNWRWSRGIIKALDRIPGLDGRMIGSFTEDVWSYLTRRAIRTEINGFLERELQRGGRTIVIAHSLGSVVAYDVLRDQGNLDIPLFLTVGSPLGIEAVRRRVGPLKHPSSVRRWFNARDERDVVALYPLAGGHFPINPTPIDHSAVWNRSDNSHGIVGYLNDSLVAAEVLKVLEAVA